MICNYVNNVLTLASDSVLWNFKNIINRYFKDAYSIYPGIPKVNNITNNRIRLLMTTQELYIMLFLVAVIHIYQILCILHKHIYIYIYLVFQR